MFQRSLLIRTVFCVRLRAIETTTEASNEGTHLV